jgi:hypothetical protein
MAGLDISETKTHFLEASTIFKNDKHQKSLNYQAASAIIPEYSNNSICIYRPRCNQSS